MKKIIHLGTPGICEHVMIEQNELFFLLTAKRMFPSTNHEQQGILRKSTAVTSYKQRHSPNTSSTLLTNDTVRSVRIHGHPDPDEKKFHQRYVNMKKRMEDMKKQNVFTITTAAATKIRQMLQNAPLPKNCIKIGIRRQGCSGYSYTMDYATDAPKEQMNNEGAIESDEFRVTKDGIVVLVDSNAIFFLSGTELDFKSSDVEERFVFQNPNAKHHCGCGESFLV